MPAAALKGVKEFRVERRDEEPLIYTDIQQLKDDYTNDIVRIHLSYNPSGNIMSQMTSRKTNFTAVNPSTTQTLRLNRPGKSHGTYPSCLQSLTGVAGDNIKGLPTTCITKEAKETQRQGISPSRCRKATAKPSRWGGSFRSISLVGQNSQWR